MLKIFLVINFMFIVTIQPIFSASHQGAIESVEGIWSLHRKGESKQNITKEIQQTKILSIYSGDQYTLYSKNGCLGYYLRQGVNYKFRRNCLEKKQTLTIAKVEGTTHNQPSITISIEILRNEKLPKINVNTHLPAKTAILGNQLALNWTEFEPKQSLKNISLDGKILSISAKNNKVFLPIANKSGWQNWQITLSNGVHYQGKVKKISNVNDNDIRQLIGSLKETKEDHPDRLLSRAFIFYDYELYLNAAQTFNELLQKRDTVGIRQLILGTEEKMGLATRTPPKKK